MTSQASWGEIKFDEFSAVMPHLGNIPMFTKSTILDVEQSCTK